MYQLLKFLTEKGQTLSILNPQQIAQIDEKSTIIRLECDEFSTFVCEKGRKRWVWLALEAASGCIVAVHIGSRDEEDAGRLIEKYSPLDSGKSNIFDRPIPGLRSRIAGRKTLSPRRQKPNCAHRKI